MKIRTRSGLSLIEILIGATILSLFLAPAIALLSSSNTLSQASSYEVQAMQYSFELFSQLSSIAPKLDAIREATGRNIGMLLMDPAFNDALEDKTVGTPRMVFLPGTEVGIVVSPLHQDFSRRRFHVEMLDPALSAGTPFADCQFWRVTITTEWTNSVSKSVSSADYDILLEASQ